MILKINEKDVELKFGIRFVRELDKVGGVDTGNFNMGMALTKAIPALQAYDPVALSNVIYAASYGNSPRPGMTEIDDFLDNYDKIEKLFDDVTKEMLHANVVKVAAKNLMTEKAKPEIKNTTK